MRRLILAAAILILASSTFAEVNTVTIKAIYKSKEGKTARVLYRKKMIKISVDQIQNFSKAITGDEVTVVLRPEDIDLGEGQ